MSGHFSAPLGRFDWIDGSNWRLVDGFRYYLTPDEGDAGDFVDVPAGFVTNFASIPRVLQNLCPTTGKYAQIAVVHDKLFLAPVIRTPASARPCTRAEANRIFLAGAEVLGVSWVVRRVMYRALQLGSGAAWDRYRAADRAIGSTTTLQQFETATVAARIDTAGR